MKANGNAKSLAALRVLAFASATLAAMGAMAQGTSRTDAWKATVEAARKEARVVVYSAVMPQIQDRLSGHRRRGHALPQRCPAHQARAGA